MRGLAVLLDSLGLRVSGCDNAGVSGLSDLIDRGIDIHGSHDPAHVDNVDLVVRSSAVPEDSAEIARARQAGVRTLRRARALGAALNGRPLLGIAGTHGKTTITAMAGYALEAAGLDPLVMVGGAVARWRGFARPGDGPAVVEADEFDRSFLELSPTLALVSSLEPEHLDTYGGFDAARAAFAEFAERAAAEVGLLYCADDRGALELGSAVAGARAYGYASDAWCRVEPAGTPGGFPDRFVWPGGVVEVRLRVPGRHNLQNAAGAFAAGLALGADPADLAVGLGEFPGVGRRLEGLGTWGDVTIIDDYAHHPTEVRASIDALRSVHADARIVVIFQPHLFSRTRDFAGEFAAALDAADDARVLAIYPSREAPIEGVTSDLILARGRALRAIDPPAAVELAIAARSAGTPTVVAFMGAGDVTGLARAAAQRLVDDAVGT